MAFGFDIIKLCVLHMNIGKNKDRRKSSNHNQYNFSLTVFSNGFNQSSLQISIHIKNLDTKSNSSRLRLLRRLLCRLLRLEHPVECGGRYSTSLLTPITINIFRYIHGCYLQLKYNAAFTPPSSTDFERTDAVSYIVDQLNYV